MPLSNVKYNKGKKGLGRPAPGSDYISAMVFYTATLPSGFTTQKNIRQFFQSSDAIAAGILNDYSDATPATASILITAAGATGDRVVISVKDIDSTGNYPTDNNGNVLPPTVICNYTKVAGDSTMAILGASLATNINAGTLNHGYSASFNAGAETLTITAPKKFGIFLNTLNPLTLTITGSIAGTITQFANGTASDLAWYYYQINRAFIRNPSAVITVGFFPIPGGSYDFSEVNTIQNFATGSLRQLSVYKNFASEWSTNDLISLHNACIVSDNAHKNLSALYSADMISISDISTLSDLNLLSANKSSAVIGQDANAQGNFLFVTGGRSCPAIGAALGDVSLSKVSESIGWPEKFTVSDGIEFEEIGFANGQKFSNQAISDNLLDTLNDKRYIFLRKIAGENGAYWNGGHCAISSASDYAFIEDNRTIDKAIRLTYVPLAKALNGPVELNEDGTLSENTIAAYESLANLDSMVRAGEISDYDVTIDPTQLILSTGILVITIEIVQEGVARQIVVNIGYVPKISK